MCKGVLAAGGCFGLNYCVFIVLFGVLYRGCDEA